MQPEIAICPFWKNYDRKAVIGTAQLAEELGFDSLWMPEAWGYEQFQLLTELALKTNSIKLATGIANVYSRSAGLLAMSAATLDEISEGRVILGLGTSGKVPVENFHGVPFEKPLTRLRETIGILRALWRGERLAPEMSSLFEPRHFKLEMTPVRSDIPIYVASLQQKAITAVGELADGWVPTFWPFEHYSEGLGWLADGARAAGRDPADIQLSPFVSVIPMDDAEAARNMVKPGVAFYIGGMGTFYHAMFCRYGFQECADQVRDLYNSGRRQEAVAAVSDELVDAIAICGPASHCQEKLGEWAKHGVGKAIVTLPAGVPAQVAAQALRAIAPR